MLTLVPSVPSLRSFSTVVMALAIYSGPAISADAAVDPDTSEAVAITDPEAVGSWYPRTVSSEKGSAIIYAPQIDAWTDFESLSGWLAFQITQSSDDKSWYGSTRFDAETDTDIAEREVLLHDVAISELTIDGLAEDSAEYQLIKDSLTSYSRSVPLDLVLEYLPREIAVSSGGDLNAAPPPIFHSTVPAILLTVDSEPVFLPIGDTGLQFVLNTPWDILRQGDKGPLYLCYESSWLMAEEITGEWRWASSLPSQFADIPADDNWSNVRDCLPGNLNAVAAPEQAAPRVFYSPEPAELLLLDGDPQWQGIGESGPEYATNTGQELFRSGGKVYFLVSGRWFHADDLGGPWTLASELPGAFQEIPAEDADDAHAKSYIRKSVPGTRESWEAAVIASIPRKAQIVRGTESALNIDVGYAGEPTFVPVETTDIEMAVNTSYQVFRFEDAYYLCLNAVWFSGADPQGPWTFADSIPAEFKTIPPSSPAYNTTFVNIDQSDDEVIDYEYTSGYEGVYVEEDTVVYGTGYASSAVAITVAYGIYDGWWGYPYYPYYPWPPSYGYGSWYDPGTGRYGEAVVGYGPYGAAGGAAVFNPETGTYARGQAVWDSDEFAGRGYAYNPNSNTSIARNRYIDFEDNEGWSERVARRGDEWRYTESEWEDGRMQTEFESSRGTEGQVNRERDGDTIVSEGTISNGDRDATFESERERQGDTLVSDGSITGENRSATFESVREDGQTTAAFEGSEGGSGTVNRQLDDGEISGSGSFTRDGKTIETDVTRTAEGVQRTIDSSGGGQATTLRRGDESAFVAESGSGDVYAGRDGNVYQKTGDGWAPVENPGATSSRSGAREPREDRAYATQSATSQFGSSRTQLDRDYQSRQQGFDRYSRHQSTSRNSSGAGRYNRRRRR